MKRFVIVASILVVVLLVAWLGSTFAFSALTEKGITNYFETNESLPYSLESYKRGLFSSEGVIDLSEGKEADDAPFLLKTKLYHGPVAMTPRGLKPGLAYSVTTIDLDKIGPEVATLIKGIFRGNDPISLTTIAGFGGSKTMRLDIASADYDQDGITVRFDGGSGEIKISGENNEFVGDVDISALYFKDEDKESTMTLRTNRTKINFDVANPGRAILNGTVGQGKIRVISGEEGGGGAMSLEFDDLTMSSKFTSADSSFPNVLFGKGKYSLPKIRLKFDDQGSFTLNDLEVNQLSEKKSGKFHTEVSYSVGSLESDNELLKDLSKQSAELKMGFTGVPMEVASILAEFSQANQAANLQMIKSGFADEEEVSQEQLEMLTEKLPELMKTLVEKISKGTGVFLSLDLKDDGRPSSLIDIVLQYDSPKKLIAQGTLGEVVNAIAARANIELDKEMVDANPILQPMIATYIEGGMVQEKRGKYVFLADLSQSKVFLHGQEVPLLEGMEPMLEQEMDWDAFLEGMAEGMKQQQMLEDMSDEPAGGETVPE